jgi:hypothetical protein
MPWLRRLVACLAFAGFSPWSLHVRQIFVRFIWFSLSVSSNPVSAYSYRMNNEPVGGRSSETQSHPIDTNNINQHYIFALINVILGFEIIYKDGK